MKLVSVFSSESFGGSSDITVWNLNLNDWLVHGCKWLHGYLKNNPNVRDADRAVCDEVLQNDKD